MWGSFVNLYLATKIYTQAVRHLIHISTYTRKANVTHVVTVTNAYIWAFDMAQVTNMLIICLLRVNLAVTRWFFFSTMCHSALVSIAVLRNPCWLCTEKEIKWKAQTTSVKASVKNHYPVSINNVSQVPQAGSPTTIIRPLFSPGSIAQLLYYPKTVSEVTNVPPLCPSHQEDWFSRRHFGPQSRLRCHKPQLSLLTGCSRMWEALDHLCSFSWRGPDPKAPGACAS